MSAELENPLLLLKSVDEMEILMGLEEERYKETRTRLRQELRDQFVAELKSGGHPATARRLKNSRPERLLWEVVTPTNVEEIRDKLLTLRGE